LRSHQPTHWKRNLVCLDDEWTPNQHTRQTQKPKTDGENKVEHVFSRLLETAVKKGNHESSLLRDELKERFERKEEEKDALSTKNSWSDLQNEIVGFDISDKTGSDQCRQDIKMSEMMSHPISAEIKESEIALHPKQTRIGAIPVECFRVEC